VSCEVLCQKALFALIDEPPPGIAECPCVWCRRSMIVRETSRLAAVLEHGRSRYPVRTWALEAPNSDPVEDPVAAARALTSAMPLFVESLRKRYARCEVAYVIELGHETNRPHAHVASLGSKLRLSALRDAADDAWLHLRIQDGGGAVAKPVSLACYAMKLWLSTLLMSDPQEAHLTLELGDALNGGQYFAATPAFRGEEPTVITAKELAAAAAYLEPQVLHFAGTFKHSTKLPSMLLNALGESALELEGTGADALLLDPPADDVADALAEALSDD
jgi:hypothetical protein